MKRIFLYSSLLVMALFIVTSCIKFEEELDTAVLVPDLPEQAYDYISLANKIDSKILGGQFDNSFDSFGPNGSFNQIPINNDQATLGRVLFYDQHLSLNDAVSCASCHQQDKAFADGKAASIGFGGKVTPRNSMAIVNVRANNNLFWDSRVPNLTQLILEPVQNHIEMGMESVVQLEKKLAEVDYYPALFEKAYGDPSITGERISNSVAQFLSTIASTDAKFDQVREGEASFSPLEQLGEQLFFSPRTQCGSCHAGANFSAPDFPGGEYGDNNFSFNSSESPKGTANIGLDIIYDDNGRSDGKFKIPSLRNVGLTAPYMHDGRFETLKEVVEHYDGKIQLHEDLDDKFLDDRGEPIRLNLSDLEKQALVAFLHTLTDEHITSDVRYSDPFNN